MDTDELVAALRDGQAWAAPALVTMLAPVLLGYATLHGGGLTRADHEAAVDTAIERAAAKIEKYDPGKGSFSVYLRPFVRHALNDIRRSRGGSTLELPDAIPVTREHVDDETDERAAEKNALREAVGRLSPTDQLILTLRETDKLSYAQCAEVIGSVTAGACRVRHHRALQRLLEQAKGEPLLARYFEDELT